MAKRKPSLWNELLKTEYKRTGKPLSQLMKDPEV